jgi:hypothetical protein
MLFVTGGEDHISPPSINRANLKRQQRAKSATEYKEYPGRTHLSRERTAGRRWATTPWRGLPSTPGRGRLTVGCRAALDRHGDHAHRRPTVLIEVGGW